MVADTVHSLVLVLKELESSPHVYIVSKKNRFAEGYDATPAGG